MEYQIEGAPLPVVICQLEAGETMLTERGSMSWMTPNMKMETSTNGGLGKAFGRMLSGDSIFQNRYTAQGGQGLIAFASSFPGSIRAFDIGPGRELVVQKSGFLASEAGVQLSVFFQKKLGSGFFGIFLCYFNILFKCFKFFFSGFLDQSVEDLSVFIT